jgi:8-oxo-dGTP pyrophosphatase MutT (NUDIX family)
MYYKIYFGDKPVFLCDDVSSELHEYLHHPDNVFIDETSRPALKSMLHEIIKPDFHSGIIYSKDLEKLKSDFFKLFTIIEAAGGLVENEKNEYLLIYRRGYWDLPKGKIDKGEIAQAAAIREVEEETGVKGIKPGRQLLTTYHTYHAFGKFILKPSHWYAMKVTGKQNIVPQTEEDITEVKWVKKNDLKKYFSNMYASVKDLLENFTRT